MEVHGCSPVQGQADAETLRTLYMALMDGWNRGSAEAFAAPFDDDLEFVAFDGTRFRGRGELVRWHEPLFKTHLRGTRLIGDVTDIRFLGPDSAVVHARGSTIMRGRTTPSPERDSIQTLVATKRDGVWRLVAFQNTRVRPIGRNLLGTLCWLVGDWFWKWCTPRGPAEAGHYITPEATADRARRGSRHRRSTSRPEAVWPDHQGR
jgi:uncharacterized protein (TIGR02246 family)